MRLPTSAMSSGSSEQAQASAARASAFSEALARARSFDQGGHAAAAEKAFEAAFGRAGDDAHLLLELALSLLASGRIGHAEQVVARAEGLYTQATPAEDARSLDGARLEVASRMADAHLRGGRITRALGHLEQAVVLGAGAPIQDLFISLLSRVTFREPHPSVKPILKRAVEEGWADSGRLARLGARLLLLDPRLRALGRKAGEEAVELEAELVDRELCDPLLLTLLDRTLIVDPELERSLTAARRAVLARAGARGPACEDQNLQTFAVALANQCFATEYAYAISAAEQAAVDALAGRCRSQLSRGSSPSVLELSAVAAYAPLASVLTPGQALAQAWPAEMAPLITRQVREPQEEADLRPTIPKLTPINDPGSQAVKAQYEDNPFPRWVGPPARRERRALAGWIADLFPAAPPPPPSRRHQALIAGCGTGQETVALARTLSDVDFLAIDLSCASLAHARRRALDLGHDDIEFGCADILQIATLGRTFDLVVSAGVLHHLDDPAQGLRALAEATRRGGVMLIALYSTLGRRHLEPARAFARKADYAASPEGLRRYRADVLALSDPSSLAWRADLLNRDDFYSLSMLRDLVFHVRETTFDIARLATMLEGLGLRFRGFSVPSETNRRFIERFGSAADLLSLEQWAVFEAQNPDTFWHMYHFLVERS